MGAGRGVFVFKELIDVQGAAEASASLKAANVATRLGLPTVYFESDAKIIIENLHHSCKELAHWSVHSLLSKIHDACVPLNNSFVWTPRVNNPEAHCIFSWGFNVSILACISLNLQPKTIVSILNLESSLFVGS